MRRTSARIMRTGVPLVARLHAPAHPHPRAHSAGVPYLPVYTNIHSQAPHFINDPHPLNRK